MMADPVGPGSQGVWHWECAAMVATGNALILVTLSIKIYKLSLAVKSVVILKNLIRYSLLKKTQNHQKKIIHYKKQLKKISNYIC